MRKNVASQVVAAQLIALADGSDVTTGTTTVYVTVDGGTQATTGSATHEGNGCWTYAPSQAETNGNHVAFTFVNTAAVSVTVNVYPVSYDPTDSVLGLGSRLPAAASVTNMDIVFNTDFATNYNTTNDQWVVSSSAVASVTGAVGSVTGAVGGNVTGSVGSVLGGINTSAGTITTLDALDTAQDSQHTTTQAAIDAVDNFVDTEIAAIIATLGTPTDLGGGATLADNNADMAGATFATSTDSQEAIRNRGDAAWTTGAGGSDRLLMVDTTIATLSSQTSFTLTAGSDDDDAYNGCTIVIEDVSTSTQKAIGIVDDYTGSTKTVTLLQDPGVFTMATTDKVYILAEKGLKPTTSQNYHVDVTANGNVGIDWANIDNPSTSVDLSGTDIQLVDTTTTNTDMRGTDSAATAAELAKVPKSDGTSSWNATALAAINAEADTAISDAALATAAELAKVPKSDGTATWNATALASINSQCDTALSDYDGPTNTEMVAAFTQIKGAGWATTDTLEAIRDRGDVAWITATGFSTHSAADVWSVATRILTANTNLNDPTAAAIADAVLDEALSGHTTAGTVGKAISDTLADTNELQGDWTDGGRLDLILDAILADTGTDGVVLSSSTMNSIAAALLDLSAGVETNRTVRQALRLILAASAGKVAGAATTTVTIRDTNDSKDRITATVDSDGNRSAVTLDAT